MLISLVRNMIKLSKKYDVINMIPESTYAHLGLNVLRSFCSRVLFDVVFRCEKPHC